MAFGLASAAVASAVAAGTTIATLARLLPGPTPIIRCMPNTPAAIGKGMMVVVSNPNVTDQTMTFVNDLLSASGEVATIEGQPSGRESDRRTGDAPGD